MKVYTTQGADALLQFRDQIRANAQTLQQELQLMEETHKAKTHQMKLDIKRLNKQADHLQSLISAEMMSQLVAQKELEEAYRFKTQSDLELLMEKQ